MLITLSRWSPARAATVAGLILGTLGIALMRLGGAAMPTVPPGAALMLLAAVLVIATPTRWAAAPAALIALAELVAATVTLTDPGDTTLTTAGTIVRLIGVITAVSAATTTLAGARPR